MKKNKSPFSRDALTISIVNSLTSIFGGFVVFSAIGYMSFLQSVPISELTVDGKKIIILAVVVHNNCVSRNRSVCQVLMSILG